MKIKCFIKTLFSKIILYNSSCDCCDIKTVSAEVTHPLQAKQSPSEISTLVICDPFSFLFSIGLMHA